MRCVQRCACPRPLHLNLFLTSTPPLINYVETKDVTENIIVELDKNGVLVSMTIEHANDHIDIESFSYLKMAAATP